jgi:hypothetical protein
MTPSTEICRIIEPAEFFKAFKEASRNVLKSKNSSQSIYGKKLWTKEMREVLTVTLKELKREKLDIIFELGRIDYTICEKDLPSNKVRYKQPLHVHALIEHENGPSPEEEYWKLLHRYAPLKVIIFYSENPRKILGGFLDTYKKVYAFHPRVSSENYLFICGDKIGSYQWKAWEIRDFNPLYELS